MPSWRGPYDHLDGRFGASEAFDLEGIVPVAYVVFALALVLFLGTVLRRTIPAVVGSFVAFLVLRLWIAGNARPGYQAPLLTRQGAGSLRDGGAWILSSDWVDRHGRIITDGQVFSTCSPQMSGGVPDKHAFVACLQRHGFVQATRYQPAGRFWTFQVIETAIFFGLAAALLAGVILWVRYRIT